MFIRSIQLDQLEKCTDIQCIKVITGVRRCGKTILLRQVKDSLRRHGIANNQIHFFNFGQFHRRQLIDWHLLAASISKKLIEKKINYLFLDELDQLDHVLPFLQEIIKHHNVSLYVTAASQSFLDRLAPLQARLVIIPVLLNSASTSISRPTSRASINTSSLAVFPLSRTSVTSSPGKVTWTGY